MLQSDRGSNPATISPPYAQPSGSMFASAGILESMSLRAQTITSRNPGAAIESILIWRNG